MPLTKPELVEAEAGRPITAQAWNVIVNGLDELYNAVLAIGTGSADVSVVVGGQPVPGARVVAQPLGEGHPVAALPPFGERTTHSLFGVNDGNWRIHVDAPGFETLTTELELPAEDTVVLELTRAGVTMPDLFAVGAKEALKRLAGMGLDVDLILDSMGVEVSHRELPPEYANSEVLVHYPAAGAVVDPDREEVRLVIAAAVRTTPTVTMPSLIGLTQDEASSVLAGLGLRIGKSTVRQS